MWTDDVRGPTAGTAAWGFNAQFTIDGVAQEEKPVCHVATPNKSHQHTIIAYADNASIMEGSPVRAL